MIKKFLFHQALLLTWMLVLHKKNQTDKEAEHE